MTPINETLIHIINLRCLVIVGTKDKVFSDENTEIVKKYNNVELVLIDGVNHSLEFDNGLEGCIKILSRVTDLYVKFIK